MTDKITVRNNATLEIKEFDNLQQIADFLHAETYPGDWVGFEELGPLPDPTEPETLVQTGIPTASNQFADLLYGTNLLPSTLFICGQDVQLGTVVAAAHVASGLSVKEWNGLPNRTRDHILVDQIHNMIEGVAQGANQGEEQHGFMQTVKGILGFGG